MICASRAEEMVVDAAADDDDGVYANSVLLWWPFAISCAHTLTASLSRSLSHSFSFALAHIHTHSVRSYRITQRIRMMNESESAIISNRAIGKLFI